MNEFIYIINISIVFAILLLSTLLISISNKLDNKYPSYLIYSMYPISTFIPKINMTEHNLIGGFSGIWY